MVYSEILFYILLVLVAFLYSSVGHGGASGYLALMAFFSFAPATMQSAALLMNIFVSMIAFIQYQRKNFFKWDLFWPFAIASVPAAFIGAMIKVDPSLYKKILGILLLFPVIRLAGFKYRSDNSIKEINIKAAMIIGLVVGLFSGMIGIGGGILLSPIILLMHWADIKHTAAVSALFIFVNSVAGLAGIITIGFVFLPATGWMIALALAGGMAGSYFGARRFDNLILRRMLALVLVIASVKLILT